MTEKVNPPETGNNQPPHGEIGGGNRDSHSPRLPSIPGNRQPPFAVQEPSIKVVDAIRKNLPGFLYALIVIFVNAFGAILYFLLSRGLIKDFVDLIYLFVKYLFYLIVIADLSALIWGITSIIYRNKSKKIQQDSVDRQVLYGYTRLTILTDEHKAFIRFHSKFGKRKLSNLERVERITIKMLESGEFRQIEKEGIRYILQGYTTSGVYQLSRDGLYIETKDGVDALKIYAMQTVFEEETENRGSGGSIDLRLDIRPARRSKKMWWDDPYDKILQNIALIVKPSSVSRIIAQLLAAYKRDKDKYVVALQLACKVAISGVFVENKILRELLQAVTED